MRVQPVPPLPSQVTLPTRTVTLAKYDDHPHRPSPTVYGIVVPPSPSASPSHAGSCHCHHLQAAPPSPIPGHRHRRLQAAAVVESRLPPSSSLDRR
ncbi:hypothetical protein E2562_016157 [Oryza meyeriana var. granulata]|uniref:Uncharacterized protein n=1 Tax=Oryza meyeriana var. granulata TaxID=110450 RepID=A0A6G1F8S3_9ORYZ|nr:hypothetical protein E2562_016157 [Oryza meyeriana var. granulata]